MRDNLPPRFVGPPPQSKERLQRHKDPEVKRKEKKKIDKARRERGYNVTEVVGMTCLFMHFFLIPKGDDNIWMARPASGSGSFASQARCSWQQGFRWLTVKLNLPGSSCYDPAQPWISKRRAAEESRATLICTLTIIARLLQRKS